MSYELQGRASNPSKGHTCLFCRGTTSATQYDLSDVHRALKNISAELSGRGVKLRKEVRYIPPFPNTPLQIDAELSAQTTLYVP
jgi:hypothetical protein